jgi:hypothetical protein
MVGESLKSLCVTFSQQTLNFVTAYLSSAKIIGRSVASPFVLNKCACFKYEAIDAAGNLQAVELSALIISGHF